VFFPEHRAKNDHFDRPMGLSPPYSHRYLESGYRYRDIDRSGVANAQAQV
jgi:hypothetical protein